MGTEKPCSTQPFEQIKIGLVFAAAGFYITLFYSIYKPLYILGHDKVFGVLSIYDFRLSTVLYYLILFCNILPSQAWALGNK